MSYSVDLNEKQIQTIINLYQDYAISLPNNYTIFCIKYKSTTLTIYKTNKMLVQGTNALDVYNEVCEEIGLEPIEKEIVNDSININLSVIGTDEVGTGDFFGGIVVSGCFVGKDKISVLKKLGVKDSKLLSDSKILEIAPIISKEVPCFTYYLDPIKYNYIIKSHGYNMNKIKALMHNTVISHITSKIKNYDTIVIDAFTTRDKYFEYLGNSNNIVWDVSLEEKGESKYISIAAASIVARFRFLKEMDEITKIVGFEIPLGASHRVDLAIAKIIKEKGPKFLEKVGKTNFKNLDKAKTLI